MSATLVELESHPGLEHVRRYPPTGVTAQRWAVIEKSLAQLWEDLGRMTSILDSARMVRARRSKLDDDDRAELTRLLRERPARGVAPADPVGAAHDRRSRRGGRVRRARRHGGSDARRIPGGGRVPRRRRSGSTRWSRERLAPTQKRLDAAGAAGPEEIAELLADLRDRSAVADHAATSRSASRAIADGVERRSAELAELAALQANWPEALATTARSSTSCGTRAQRAAEVRAHAEQKRGGRLPSGARRRRAGPARRARGPSPHRIRRRCGRCGTGSRRRCEPSREERSSSRRACSTVAANSRDG